MADASSLNAAIQAIQAQRDRGDLDAAAADAAMAVLRQQLLQLGEATHRPAAERKQITVMFADMSGFTALSETTDAEEMRSLVNECFDTLGDVITRYGGHIDKFIGDELMVLFGAPLAMEDHAARALHAALELHERFARFNEEHAILRDRPLALHTGVNSGLVVAGAIGTEARREYTVMGDAVNVAARLVAQATPGAILVGESTRRLGGDDFDFEDLGEVTLEGRAAAQRVYRLQCLKSGADVARGTVRHAMVGRETELAFLQDTVRLTARDKRARVVAVVGAAGIGKSRLRDELRDWLDSEDMDVHILEGAALPHMTTTPYFIIADLLRRHLGVAYTDSAASVRLRLEGVLRDLGIDEGEYAHALAAILAVDYPDTELNQLSAEERRRRIFSALSAFILKLTERAPTLLLLNDLHWVDDLSLDILEHIVGDLQGAAVMMVTFTRPVADPESRIRRAETRLTPDVYTRLVLDELSAEASRRLLLSLASGLDRSPSAIETILNKAQGNPFFIEEIVHSLQDNVDGPNRVASASGVAGLEKLSVPDTVWGVLAERIDRLPPDEKSTIQSAAIVGRVFWQGAVQQLTRQDSTKPLAMLETREMLERIGPAPFGEDWEWKFRHALVQEVAYSTLLFGTRKTGHLAAAGWLERAVGDRIKEYATLLAHHYSLGEDWTQAARYAEQAGDRASDLFAHSEASAAYLQTLSALGQLDQSEANSIRQVDVTLKLSREAFFSPTEDVLRALETAKRLADEVADTERQIRVLVATAAWYYDSGQPRLAVELALQAIGSAKQAGLDELLVVPYLILAPANFMTGGFRSCIDLMEQAEALGKRLGTNLSDRTTLGMGRNKSLLGAAYQQLGEIERGRELAKISIRESETSGDRRQIAIAHLFFGATSAAIGRFDDECREQLERSLVLCEEANDVTAMQTALGWLGRTLAWQGDIEQGAAKLDRALHMFEELGFMPFRPFMQAYRAEILIMCGEPEQAVELTSKALVLARETRQRSAEAEVHRVLGWALHYARPDSEEILDHFRNAVEIHRSCEARAFQANALFDLARYLRISGREQDARAPEDEAQSLVTERGMSWLPLPALEPLEDPASLRS